MLLAMWGQSRRSEMNGRCTSTTGCSTNWQVFSRPFVCFPTRRTETQYRTRFQSGGCAIDRCTGRKIDSRSYLIGETVSMLRRMVSVTRFLNCCIMNRTFQVCFLVVFTSRSHVYYDGLWNFVVATPVPDCLLCHMYIVNLLDNICI